MNDLTCYCDYERPDFYRSGRPLASKPHVCTECGGCILPGERYETVFAKWNGDGRPDTVKTCVYCLEIRDLLDEMDCFCWSHHGLWNDITDQFQNADFKPGARFRALRLVANHPMKAYVTCRIGGTP